MITNRARLLWCAAALACCAAAAPANAQDVTLDRVQNLAATGRFTDARTTLAGWELQHADPRSAATAADRARALFLRGTLSTEPAEAEEAYLGVVLSYPSSDAAPQALLRLGQGLLANGEPRRAVAYLERLRSDYPASPARETGWLWLARAQLAVGAPTAACAATRDGLAAVRDANVRTLLELEQDRACSGASAASAAAQHVRAAEVATTARWAVQAAAFRERSSADATAAQLRQNGFDARVVVTEGSVLYRVRFGAFTTNEQAAEAARQARTAGFNVIVVSDVAMERVR